MSTAKRKRHEGDLNYLNAFQQSAKRRKPLNRGLESGSRKDARKAGLSDEDALGAALGDASGERRAECGQAEKADGMQDDRLRKAKKHRKKKNSNLNPSEVDSAAATEPRHSTAAPANGEVSAAKLDLEKSLFPEGLSRHQRKRLRRKLIKRGANSKDQHSELGSLAQSQAASQVPARVQKQKDLAWADKPIGRAAMAKRLATTSLMQPPARRWDEDVHQPVKPRSAGAGQSTPWQRGAVKSGKAVLAQASAGPKSDAKSVVSGIPQACADSREGTHHRRPSRPSAFICGLAPPASVKGPKRSSFGTKANSVPTHFVDGDVAENFRRFSALQDDGGDSSETSSDSDDGLQSSTRDGRDTIGYQAEASFINPARPGPGGENINGVGHASKPGEFDDLIPPCELMLGTNRAPKPLGVKHTIFGSEVGGGRSSTPVTGEQDIDDGASSIVGDDPIAVIDEETIDAHQAMDEIFRDAMRLTRELPAGKSAPIQYAEQECEDGILTRVSSDRRLTRSASKSKPMMLHKRIDSAIPEPGSDIVIVQSVRLPESEGPAPGDDAGGPGPEDDEVDRRKPAGSNEEEAQGTLIDSHGRSSSPLSELSRSPSPLQKRQTPLKSSNASPSQKATSQAGEDEDTIAVAVPDEPEVPRKKRKMTGRTSKHFSTPKAKMKPSSAIAAPMEDRHGGSPSNEAMATEQKRTSKKGKRSLSTKELLEETRKLVDGGSPTLDESEGPRPPKKRSRRSKAQMADREDVGRSSPLRNGDDADAANTGLLHDEQMSRATRKRRSRHGSAMLANIDLSNIIEDGQRRSRAKPTVRDDHALEAPEESQSDQQEASNVNAIVEAGEEEDELTPPKKRARRSGGKITDLDASNIIEGRPRARRRSSEEEFVPPLGDLGHAEEEAESANEASHTKTRSKRKSTGKRSAYFIPPKPPLDPLIDRVDHYNTTAGTKRAPAGVSIAPVPSIHSDRFGIIQETLWREPFWLLIATAFLNKTTGRAAAPKFWAVKEKYPTPAALAEADRADVFEMVKSLGFQNQRSERIIKMALAWVEREPEKGVRWRKLHYPCKGDGKGFKKDMVVEEDADEVEGAIEIGGIPGTGVYACDSWRIFCRDVLRGVAEDYNGKVATKEDFVPEWKKVLPEDKELRACLRWMWLRDGWIWDHKTGEKRRATEEEMERAVRGEMDVPDAQEGKFAAQAAGVEVAKVARKGKGKAKEEGKLDDGDDKSELSSQPPSGELEVAQTGKGKAAQGRKRAATPDQEDAGSSDNIVVTPPAKKKRASRREPALRTLGD